MTAKQLRKWQAEKNLSDDDAAKTLGVKLRQYQNLKRGASKISRTMHLLIEALG